MNIPNTLKKHPLIFLLSVGLLCAFTAQGQPGIEWDRTYGGTNYEELQAMDYAGDGYIFAGHSTSGNVDVEGPNNGLTDAWVFKTDVTAETIIWQSSFGCDGREIIWDILPLPTGEFLLLAASTSDICNDKSENSRGEEDYWLIKIDANGNKIWDRTYGGEDIDIARRILPTDDGNYLIGGHSWSTDSITSGVGERTHPNRGEADIWILKITPDGDVLEDYVFSGVPVNQYEGDEKLFDMTKMSDGTFLLGCWSESNSGFEKTTNTFGRNDFWLLHIDENGNKVADVPTGKTGDYSFGGNSVDALQKVIETQDGGILLIGESFSDPYSQTLVGNKTTPHYGGVEADEDYWIVKLNPDFTIAWQRTFGGDKVDIPHVVWENASGKLWIAGDSTSPNSGNKENTNINGTKDIWMLLLTPDGEKIWEQTFGGDGYEVPEEILLAHDGGYIIGGQSSSNQNFWKSEDSRGLNDFWIIKTNCPIYEADMDIETDVCLGQPFELAPEFALCPDCDFQWTDDGTSDTIRIVSLTENTDYELLITDDNGCEETAIVQTIVQSNPEILELEFASPTCTDYTDGYIEILEASGGIEPYEYSISDDNFKFGTEFRNLGANEYQLVLKDSIGCNVDSTITLINPLLPLIDIGEDLIIELGDSLLIQVAVSPGVDTFIWENPDLVTCPDCPFTYTRPTVTTLYQITAYNEQGCEVRDIKSVGIKREFPYYAPNAFSPDNNGENEFFTIFTSDAVAALRNFTIYNRWGSKIFQSDNLELNNPAAGWDGFYRGRNAQTGVYIWYAEIEFIDGRKEVIKGDVSLFR
jgi:gliding motility-associated-like protein